MMSIDYSVYHPDCEEEEERGIWQLEGEVEWRGTYRQEKPQVFVKAKEKSPVDKDSLKIHSDH